MSRTFRKSASPAAILTEVHSLHWLSEAVPQGGAAVAELVGFSENWLETRMLDAASPSPVDARSFGRRLALTHAAGADFFGAVPPGLPVRDAVLAELPSPSLPEPLYDTWGEFFAELRLAPYMTLAASEGAFDRAQADRLWMLIDRVAHGDFDADQPQAVHRSGPSPAVARVHGDLWGGNIVWARTDDGAVGTLIDPSAHGGHAETDLAELGVFGSPHLKATLAGYQEVSPLADGWLERLPVHQLHMLLVHVVKFGGGYVSQTVQVAERFT
ncbi:MAG: fructosamine kinase family protein [Propionibacteriaceae bacterium]|nr:fructosamine kinase family protein [Propionibacteriaceae bacterium]